MSYLIDLKAESVLFNAAGSDMDIEEQLNAKSTAVLQGEVQIKGQKYPVFKPQPLHHHFPWNVSPFFAEVMDINVCGLGQGIGFVCLITSIRAYCFVSLGPKARRVGEEPTDDNLAAHPYKAPELIIRSDFGPKVDIWALGCMVSLTCVALIASLANVAFTTDL
jgi:serine/threonine-protein kinase SRPK3